MNSTCIKVESSRGPIAGVLEPTESKAKQLYFQDRSFGFAVLQLIISRLIENNECLMQAESGNLAAFDILDGVRLEDELARKSGGAITVNPTA